MADMGKLVFGRTTRCAYLEIAQSNLPELRLVQTRSTIEFSSGGASRQKRRKPLSQHRTDVANTSIPTRPPLQRAHPCVEFGSINHRADRLERQSNAKIRFQSFFMSTTVHLFTAAASSATSSFPKCD